MRPYTHHMLAGGADPAWAARIDSIMEVLRTVAQPDVPEEELEKDAVNLHGAALPFRLREHRCILELDGAGVRLFANHLAMHLAALGYVDDHIGQHPR